MSVSHHGTDGLLPVRSLSRMDVSQFRHDIVVLQVASRPQAPAEKTHKSRCYFTDQSVKTLK